MNKHVRLIPALALGMAVLSMPTLATAATTTINVGDTAAVVVRGAGALVSVEVTCDPSIGSGSQLFANVNLSERAGNKVAVGSGFIQDTINCDGTPQTFQVIVASMSLRFRQGTAVAQASANVFNPISGQSGFAQVTKQIQLVVQK